MATAHRAPVRAIVGGMEKPAPPEAAPTNPGVQTARQLAHEHFPLRGDGWCHWVNNDHSPHCDALTAAIEADRAARDRQHEAALKVSNEIAERWQKNAEEMQDKRDAVASELADLRTNARAEKTRLQNALAEETQARSDEFFRLTSLRDVLLHERDDATAALAASRAETAAKDAKLVGLVGELNAAHVDIAELRRLLDVKRQADKPRFCKKCPFAEFLHPTPYGCVFEADDAKKPGEPS